MPLQRPVSVRLSEPQERLLRRAAGGSGASLSGYIRDAALARAITELAAVGDPALEWVRLAIDPARLADVQRALADDGR